MTSQFVTPSKLEIHKYDHKDEDGSTTPLWRVEIDGTTFSKTMSPFKALDPRVERFGCTVCGTVGDGTGIYGVRRLKNYVLWFYSEMLEGGRVREFENLPQIYVFEGTAYEAAIGDGSFKDIPEMQTAELLNLVRRYLPTPDLALYTIPDIEDDPRGQFVLAKIQELFNSKVAIIYSVDGPEEFDDIRIGLESETFAEAHWLIAQAPNKTSIMFTSAPSIPVWIEAKIELSS